MSHSARLCSELANTISFRRTGKREKSPSYFARMQFASTVKRTLEHLRHPQRGIYHGDHCTWCRYEQSGHNPLTERKEIALPYLHPESSRLHSSEQHVVRKWLLVCQGEESCSYVTLMQRCMKGYVAKYGFDHSMEVSGNGVSRQYLSSAYQWLLRDHQRTRVVTWVGTEPPPMPLFDASALCREDTLWVFWDHLGQQASPPCFRLGYTYRFAESGSTNVTSYDAKGDEDRPTTLLCYLEGNTHAPTLFQRALLAVLVNQNGHRSMDELMCTLHRHLRSYGLRPVIECNRMIDPHQLYFGFPYYTTRAEEARIPELPLPKMPQTKPRRMRDDVPS